MKRFTFAIFFLLLTVTAALPLFGQSTTKPDTTGNLIRKLTNLADSSRVQPDSLAVKPDSSQGKIKPADDLGIEAPVEYSARTIDSDQENGIIVLIGDAAVKYKKITIEAGKIIIKQKENLLLAEGLPDTANGIAANGDSLQNYTGLPVFSDGTETMYGERMEYNFKSDRGRIIRGRTQFQKGYYHGDVVKIVNETQFNIANGKYTTCDKAEPHFHFRGKKMKVLMNDKVIAKPVIFFIGKIPLAIIPFAMFPTKENGRQSGLIIPQYGSSPFEGRYLRGLGYYWATSEYFDVNFTMDFFEKTGFLFRSRANYALRYNLSGSVDASMTLKDFPDGRRERDWSLAVRHSQTINETSNFSVNARFITSNDFYRNFSNNLEQRLSRQIVSNATFNKRWSEGGRSLSINLSQTKDLKTGSNFTTLPRLNFSQSQRALIPFKTDKTGRSKKQPSWYNAIRYSYSTLVLNTVREDSSNDTDPDINRRVEHNLSFSYTNPKKLFGWLTLGQGITYDEDWFDHKKEFIRVDSSNSFKEGDEDKGFAARRTFNYSANASTNIFGTFSPRIGPVRALRHKMSPSISFRYQPDFSDEFWGYYQILEDTARVEKRLDRFVGTPRGKQMSLNYSLSNLFQMKLGEGENEKKIDLFNLNFSSSYNFAADSLNFGNLSTSFRANPRKNIGVTMNMTHSFYKFSETFGRVVDTLLISENGIFDGLRMTRLQFDLRWSLNGRKQAPQTSGNKTSPQVSQQYGQSGLPGPNQTQDLFAPESAFSALDIPWSANISFSYSLNKFNPANPSKTAYINLSNVQVQLTKNWRIGYRMRYDLEKSEIVEQRLSFYRDLHCWEAEFNWSPSGLSSGYYFRIGIKAPNLRDVKLEHRGGTTSVFRPF